jgi:hypothetical protein
MAKLVWDHSGRVSSDGRYRIGELVTGNQRTYYLETSPLYEVDVRKGPDNRPETVVTKDEVPRGDKSLAQVRKQAQAIEDDELAEFEQGRPEPETD